MKILGIDPGYGLIGYGVLEKTNTGIKMIDFGAITTPKEKKLSERLKIIFDCMKILIDKYQPDEMAVEQLYFGRNVTTAIGVAEARGVILLSAEEMNIPVFEYTPQQIKIALTGMGKADKSQVQFMVKTIIGLEKTPRPDDAADALAVAICHSQTNQAMRGL